MKSKLIIFLSFMLLFFISCSDNNSGDSDASTNDVSNDALTDVETGDVNNDDAQGDTIENDISGDALSDGIRCDSFNPTIIAIDSQTTISFYGANIVANTTADFVDRNGQPTKLSLTNVSSDGSTGTIILDSNTLTKEIFTITLESPSGDSDLCEEQLRVSTLPPPTVTNVEPPQAWKGLSGDGILSDEKLTITGTNFRITPTVRWVNVSDSSIEFTATVVNWISDTQITAVCPSESLAMPLGDYYVYVTNPEGFQAQWIEQLDNQPGIFRIVDVPPPMITQIDPTRGSFGDNVNLTVKGHYFQDGAVISLQLGDGSWIDLQTTFNSSEEISGLILGGTLSAGLYPVKVTNPDLRFDTYYSYQATTPSEDKFQAYQFTTIEGSELTVERERHASVEGFDSFGGSYIYTTGGINKNNSVLSDGEFYEVSLQGNIGPSIKLKQYFDQNNIRADNTLNTARHGHTLVRVGRFLYAIGGADLDTNTNTIISALKTVERARILGYETMPAIHMPNNLKGNGLPYGTWYYRVSAVGSWGESLASKEIQIRNVSGSNEICWSSVTDASGYNIYRNPAADGRSGTERLVATNVSGNCYIDDGKDINQTAPGRLYGEPQSGTGLGLGIWIYRVTAVVNGTETVAGYREYVEITDANTSIINLKFDPVPGATYNIYRSSQPVTQITGNEETYLLDQNVDTNEYVDDGTQNVDTNISAPDGITVLPNGSISRWETLTDNNTINPREGLRGIAVKVPSGYEDVDDRTFIYIVGGRTDNSTDNANVYLKTIEKAEVYDNGELSPWVEETITLNIPRAFHILLSSKDRDSTPTTPDPEEPPCEDYDGDGHTAQWCGGDDCNDNDNTIYPGAPEICEDGIDQNCDGEDVACQCDDPDEDDDGHDRIECGGDDCNDNDNTIYPGAPEICDDNIDQDCDGFDEECNCPVDADGDQYDIPECGGDDCDDTNADIHPGAQEIFCNGIDEDCSGIDECEIWIKQGHRNIPSFIDICNKPIDISSNNYIGTYHSTYDEPLYLVVGQGDNIYETAVNRGLENFEIIEIGLGDGEILSCTEELEALPQGRRTLGHGGLLYAGHVWIIPGVSSESIDTEPQPLNNTVSTFDFDIGASNLNQVIINFNSAATQFTIPRSYYTLVRLNSWVFVIGGNDGITPISTVERVPE